MGMKDRSLIDKIIRTFIALTMMAIHHCLSVWITGEFRIPPEFGPEGGAQRKSDTRNINYRINTACIDVFCRLDVDFRSSSPEVQAKKIDTISSMIGRRINSTSTNPAMAQPHNYQGNFDENILDYVQEELIEQSDNSCNHLSSFGAATEGRMRVSAVLPMCGSAITSSSQPIPCSDSNSNSNDITSITNMTSIENLGLVDGSTIIEGAMLFGG